MHTENCNGILYVYMVVKKKSADKLSTNSAYENKITNDHFDSYAFLICPLYGYGVAI